MIVRGRKRGFSLVEILIAVSIIAIVSFMVLSHFGNRGEKAKTAVAMNEMREIAKAIQACIRDTGYYVRLSVLNDPNGAYPGGDPMGKSKPHLRGILDEAPQSLLISVDGGQLADAALGKSTGFWLNWNGPYINYHRDSLDEDGNGTFEPDKYEQDDVPEDPWGGEYILWTGGGLNGFFVPDGWDGNSKLWGVPGAYPVLNLRIGGQIFQARWQDPPLRAMLICTGPNGIPGPDSGNGLIDDPETDDLLFPF